MRRLVLWSLLLVLCSGAPQTRYREDVRRPVKRQYQETPARREYQPAAAPSETYASESYQEPSYSSGSYSNPDHDRYSQAVAAEASQYRQNLDGGYGGGDERITFQIHGQEGPHSYKFGFDTGKGYDRQFRYEERDGYGFVRGRYGFYDKYGKLRIVNYFADPYKGFHAEGDFGKFPHNKH